LVHWQWLRTTFWRSNSSQALHMNAAWFAAVNVVSKEWLFRITHRKQFGLARECITPPELREASSR